MGVLDTISDYYHSNDPRTSDKFLISRPGTVVTILLFYNYFCVSLGPRIMRKRPPYPIREILVIYNFIQILISVYLFYEGLMAGWLFEYSYSCQPIDHSHSPSALRMARSTHLYFVCKLVELLDTVFFVLRKKERQISFLHLYHHTFMPLFAWYGVRYFPNGHGTFCATVNSFVHIIMYTYYMLAALGPGVQKYLWWKKHLTILQIVQFVLIGVHSAQILFNGCNYSKIPTILIICESVIFFFMFASFYVKNHRVNVASRKFTVTPKSE